MVGHKGNAVGKYDQKCDRGHISVPDSTGPPDAFPPLTQMAGTGRKASRNADLPASYKDALVREKGAKQGDRTDGSCGPQILSSTMYALTR